MKQFFMRLHFLITNPNAFVISYSVEPARLVFRFCLLVAFLATILTAIIRTHTVTQKLPSLLAATFPGVTVTNGKLHSANGVVVPEPWKLSDLNALLNGRTTPLELFPDSIMAVDPEGKQKLPVVFTADSLLLLGKTDKSGVFDYGMKLSWKEITRGMYDIDFSEECITSFLAQSKFSLFIGLLLSIGMQILGDLLNLWILLFLIVLIYRRELVQVWLKKSTFKILINGTIPYFILMPLFAVAGERSELLVTVGAVVSTVVIARAFRFHRMSLFSANQKDNDE